MEPPNKKRLRNLWLTFAIGLAVSLVGAAFLFNPTLEFAAVDVLEKLKLPIGVLVNIGLLSDLALFTISSLGLIVLGLRSFFRSRRRQPDI